MATMGSGAADGLQQVLQRLFLEAQFRQRQKEHADRLQLDTRGLDLDAQRLTQQGQQFDARLGQDQAELGFRQERAGVDDTRYNEAAPSRAANLRLTSAQATDLEGRPAEREAARLAAGTKDERDFEQQKELARLGASLRPAERERAVQIMGPQGTPIWVKESDAIGKPAAQAARAVTGQERQSLAYFNRAKEADELANKFEDPVAKAGIGSQLQQQFAPNMLQTGPQQQYRQAQRAFTEARLRKESGAAIPQGEYENDARTYFAQPGDTPEVRAQKRQARKTVLDGLKFSSGKAYNEFYGDEEGAPGGSTGTGGQVVTMQQLQAIAQKRGTTVEQEKQRATAEGFVVR